MGLITHGNDMYNISTVHFLSQILNQTGGMKKGENYSAEMHITGMTTNESTGNEHVFILVLPLTLSKEGNRDTQVRAQELFFESLGLDPMTTSTTTAPILADADQADITAQASKSTFSMIDDSKKEEVTTTSSGETHETYLDLNALSGVLESNFVLTDCGPDLQFATLQDPAFISGVFLSTLWNLAGYTMPSSGPLPDEKRDVPLDPLRARSLSQKAKAKVDDGEYLGILSEEDTEKMLSQAEIVPPSAFSVGDVVADDIQSGIESIESLKNLTEQSSASAPAPGAKPSGGGGVGDSAPAGSAPAGMHPEWAKHMQSASSASPADVATAEPAETALDAVPAEFPADAAPAELPEGATPAESAPVEAAPAEAAPAPSPIVNPFRIAFN